MLIGLGITLVVAVGLLAWLLFCFTRWRNAAFERFKTGGRIAQTARGPVEYAMVGRGPVVLLLHGGAGGFDQAVVMGEDLGIPSAFTLLAPSRVGYLGTPLETGKTPEEGADAMAALLDALEVSDVAVLGISGGGPTALQFTLRHPHRVRALVMMVAISGRHTQPERTTKGIGRLLFYDSGMWLVDFACWLMFVQVARFRPSLAAKWMFKASETLDAAAIKARVAQVMKHPHQIAWISMLWAHLLPLSARKVGLDNDLKQFAQIPVYPLERITCPTLVIHGRLDGNVPFEHAQFVADTVPQAELFVVEGAGHLIWLSEHAERVRSKTMDFLRAHDQHRIDVPSVNGG